jgi:hypothetical protein
MSATRSSREALATAFDHIDGQVGDPSRPQCHEDGARLEARSRQRGVDVLLNIAN